MSFVSLQANCENHREIHSLLGLIKSFEESLPAIIRLEAILDIASGLNNLHKITVRDLKPSNYFGSSMNNQLMSSAMSTNMTEVAFTIAYVAPELLSENLTLNKQSSASNIYAFGVLMLGLLHPEKDLPSFHFSHQYNSCFYKITQYVQYVDI